VPGRRIPKQHHSWLERRDLPEQQQHSAPFGIFPCRVGLDKQSVGDNCSKSAQGSHEPELPNFFPEIEVEFDPEEMFLSMKRRQIALERQFDRPDHDQYSQRDKTSAHNSFP
jgi:hypothetical protein